jgi:hypothetical protein
LRGIDKEYKARLEAAKGNTVLTDKLNAEIDAKKKAVEIASIERSTKAAIAQALIGASLAVIQTYANPTLLFPANAIIAGLIGIKTGFEIASIRANSEKQIAALKAESGAIIPLSRNAKVVSGQTIEGARHSGGGVNLLANGRLVNAEGGEHVDKDENGNVVILSRRATKRNRNILERVGRTTFPGKGALLQSMMHETGTATRNYPIHNNTLQVTRAEQGAIVQPFQRGGSAITVSASVEISDAQMNELARKIGGMTAQGARAGLIEGQQESNRITERNNNALNGAII